MVGFEAVWAAAYSLGILVVLLGIILVWRAYQGARRNDSRPMLLLAIGLLFITVLPSMAQMALPILSGLVTSISPIEYTIIVSQISEIMGIGILLYSIHTRR